MGGGIFIFNFFFILIHLLPFLYNFHFIPFSTFQEEKDTEIPVLIKHIEKISKINISKKIIIIINNIKGLGQTMLRYTYDDILLETHEKKEQAKTIFRGQEEILKKKSEKIVDNIMKEFLNKIEDNILKQINNVGRIKAKNKCSSTILDHGVC